MASAQRLLPLVPDVVIPNKGTGATGLPDRKRWITGDDIAATNSAYFKKLNFHAGISLNQKLAPVSLRGYQEEAVNSMTSLHNGGGIIEVGCGLGKTFIAAEAKVNEIPY